MVKRIIILLLALALTACRSDGMHVASAKTSAETSEVTSENTSLDNNVTSNYESSAISSEVSSNIRYETIDIQVADGGTIYFENEPIVKRPSVKNKPRNIDRIACLKELGEYYWMNVSSENYTGGETEVSIENLIRSYFNCYDNYYISGLLPYTRREGGYRLVGRDVYPMDWTYMTKYHKTDKEYEEQRYEGLCLYRYAYATFTEAVAKEVLDNPTYNGKRYHYFEKDGATFIDQSVAKKQGYLPHTTSSETVTYKYAFYHYSFDYTHLDENSVEIIVYIYNRETGMFEQFTMKAVLENGEWRLAEFFDFEERVTVCDPQPVE